MSEILRSFTVILIVLGIKTGQSPESEKCPIFQIINMHSAKELSVFRISINGVVK